MLRPHLPHGLPLVEGHTLQLQGEAVIAGKVLGVAAAHPLPGELRGAVALLHPGGEVVDRLLRHFLVEGCAALRHGRAVLLLDVIPRVGHHGRGVLGGEVVHLQRERHRQRTLYAHELLHEGRPRLVAAEADLRALVASLELVSVHNTALPLDDPLRRGLVVEEDVNVLVRHDANLEVDNALGDHGHDFGHARPHEELHPARARVAVEDDRGGAVVIRRARVQLVPQNLELLLAEALLAVSLRHEALQRLVRDATLLRAVVHEHLDAVSGLAQRVPGLVCAFVVPVEVGHACLGCSRDFAVLEPAVEVSPRCEFAAPCQVEVHVGPACALVHGQRPGVPHVAPLVVRHDAVRVLGAVLLHGTRQRLPRLRGRLVLGSRPAAPVHHGALGLERAEVLAAFNPRLLAAFHGGEGVVEDHRGRVDATVLHLHLQQLGSRPSEREALRGLATPAVSDGHAIGELGGRRLLVD
mmetsp:Transcript_22037/g.56183  ORF Transcript_22037/g.56183 Transcript_22037/m.56183 type:complete len:468 (+) Transcript_22037:1726-3129(+)